MNPDKKLTHIKCIHDLTFQNYGAWQRLTQQEV